VPSPCLAASITCNRRGLVWSWRADFDPHIGDYNAAIELDPTYDPICSTASVAAGPDRARAACAGSRSTSRAASMSLSGRRCHDGRTHQT
jgi:hypothetical protein